MNFQKLKGSSSGEDGSSFQAQLERTGTAKNTFIEVLNPNLGVKIHSHVTITV